MKYIQYSPSTCHGLHDERTDFPYFEFSNCVTKVIRFHLNCKFGAWPGVQTSCPLSLVGYEIITSPLVSSYMANIFVLSDGYIYIYISLEEYEKYDSFDEILMKWRSPRKMRQPCHALSKQVRFLNSISPKRNGLKTQRQASALWSGTNKNRDISAGSLARPFACSLVRLFACTTHLFACSELLTSLAPSTALTCSLACSLPRLWKSELLMSQNDLVLSHSAAPPSSMLSTV